MRINILCILSLLIIPVIGFSQSTKQSDLDMFLEEYPSVKKMMINKLAPKSLSKSTENFSLICKIDVGIMWTRTIVQTSKNKSIYNTFTIRRSDKSTMLFCGHDGTFKFNKKVLSKTKNKWIEYAPLKGSIKDLPNKIQEMINTPTWKFGRL